MTCVDHGKYTSLVTGGYAQRRYKGKHALMHRIAYCEHHGVAMDTIVGKVVRHTCDNPRCINPEHLLLGTQLENIQDIVDRGRTTKAQPLHRRLTAEEVVAIRRRYVKGSVDANLVTLAAEYEVSNVTIRNIITRRMYKDIE